MLESLFKKVAGLRAANLFKRGSSTDVFLEILRKFLRTFFVEHVRTGASGIFMLKQNEAKKQKSIKFNESVL